MRIKVSIRKSWQENLCILIIVLSFIEIQTEYIHDILKWPMIGLGLIGVLGSFIFSRIGTKITVLITSMIALIIIELIFSEGIFATQYIWDLGICMPVALLLYKARNVHVKKWIVLYILTSIYLLIMLLSSPDHYTIFYSHSRNYISIFEIFLMFMAAVAAYKNRRVLPGWMYYFTALVCVVAVGRGGIIAGFILLSFHILQSIAREKKKSNKYVKLMIMLAILVILFIVFLFYQDAIIQRFFPRFSGGSAEAASSDIAVNKRLLMWGAYLESCLKSFKQMLLGADPYPIVLKYHYRKDFNLHNSYIMMHVFYGLAGLVGGALLSIRFLKFFIKEKSEIAVIFISFLVRALTDHCFPGKLSAAIIWFAAFFALDNRKIKHWRLRKSHEYNF